MEKLNSSAEESAITYSRDIYEFMNDDHSDAEDSFNMKMLTEHNHKESYKFVEQLQPVSLPLVSYSTLSSARMPSAKHAVIFLSLVLSVAS